ncbi:hypothetical protein R1sor_003423 [Riccia sorocarpa]|uniref:Uncharacterized protein n=1 Tax=Riccia sorocarpa TaxID=122646 RepID=A0ABD3H373_9MARC
MYASSCLDCISKGLRVDSGVDSHDIFLQKLGNYHRMAYVKCTGLRHGIGKFWPFRETTGRLFNSVSDDIRRVRDRSRGKVVERKLLRSVADEIPGPQLRVTEKEVKLTIEKVHYCMSSLGGTQWRKDGNDKKRLFPPIAANGLNHEFIVLEVRLSDDDQHLFIIAEKLGPPRVMGSGSWNSSRMSYLEKWPSSKSNPGAMSSVEELASSKPSSSGRRISREVADEGDTDASECISHVGLFDPEKWEQLPSEHRKKALEKQCGIHIHVLAREISLRFISECSDNILRTEPCSADVSLRDVLRALEDHDLDYDLARKNCWDYSKAAWKQVLAVAANAENKLSLKLNAKTSSVQISVFKAAKAGLKKIKRIVTCK